jgi:hypothetical protein
MIDLESPKWNELQDAYGSASKIPKLLSELALNTAPRKSTLDEPWFSLWSSLCHQGDVYTASYAAVPYIVQIAGANLDAASIDMSFYSLPACIEIARAQGKGPDLPKDLKQEYQAAIRKLGEYAVKYQNADDNDLKKSAQAARLVAENKIEEADKLLNDD